MKITFIRLAASGLVNPLPSAVSLAAADPGSRHAMTSAKIEIIFWFWDFIGATLRNADFPDMDKVSNTLWLPAGMALKHDVNIVLIDSAVNFAYNQTGKYFPCKVEGLN
ncbi:MAG: hypothetical protein PVJ71_02625 [Lysobacterales bacterium]|jgi:hypothetical protein